MRDTAICEVVSPAPRKLWAELAESDDTANVYLTPAWTEAICAAGVYEDASRYYLTSGGAQLVLPMVRRRRLPTSWTIAHALPVEWGTGGLVASGAVRPADVLAVYRDLRSCGALGFRIRADQLRVEAQDASRISGVKIGSWEKHVLALDGGFGQVWDTRFSSSARTAVRKAERAGLVVERGSSESLIDEYFELYRLWVVRRAREQGLPRGFALRRSEQLRKYRAVARHLGAACTVWTARLDGEPVSSVIILSHGSYANYWRGCGNKALAGPSRANNLLFRLAIEEACREGRTTFDLGRSPVKSLGRFKQSLGAEPVELPILVLDRWAPWSQLQTLRLATMRRVRRVAAATRGRGR